MHGRGRKFVHCGQCTTVCTIETISWLENESFNFLVLCVRKRKSGTVCITSDNLPEIVITAATTDTFKRRLDKFWQHQDILYDYKVQLTRVGNRSQIYTDDNIVL